MVWERRGGDGRAGSSVAVASGAGAAYDLADSSGTSASCGMVDASAGVGSAVVVCSEVEYDAAASEAEAAVLADGSTNKADSKMC